LFVALLTGKSIGKSILQLLFSNFGTPYDSQGKMQAPQSDNHPSKNATLERKEALYSQLERFLLGVPK
jgi:hypothetical protein